MGRRKRVWLCTLVEACLWTCRSWKKTNTPLLFITFNWLTPPLFSLIISKECLVVEVVEVVGVVEVAGEDLAGQATYHQWVLHLLIYKICRERLLLCILCVVGQSFSIQWTDWQGCHDYIVTACPGIHRPFEWREAHSSAAVRIRWSDEKITILYRWENKILRQLGIHYETLSLSLTFCFQNLNDIPINIDPPWCRSLHWNEKIFMRHSFLQKSSKIISIRNERRKARSNVNFVYYYSFNSSLPASRVGPRQVKLNLEELGDEVEDQVFFSMVNLPYNLTIFLAGKIIWWTLRCRLSSRRIRLWRCRRIWQRLCRKLFRQWRRRWHGWFRRRWRWRWWWRWWYAVGIVQKIVCWPHYFG